MLENLNLRIDPRTAATDSLLSRYCAEQLRIDPKRVKKVDITRRSIDARQRRVMVNLTVRVHIDSIDPQASAYTPIAYPDVSHAEKQVIIVGAGPAGLFAALELIELGIRPIVLERGKDVDSRRADMVAINREGKVNPDSNYCFGEGGAGAYSDGKLYTRSKKRGPVDKVLQIFHTHGAQDAILVDAHPHIGTDRLPAVIKAMRGTILAAGGQVHFGTKVTGLIRNQATGAVEGARSADGQQWLGPVLLATGHSARDVYHMLADADIAMQPKGIAVGVRLEHPQELIDRLQYHSPQGRGKYLPPAEYSILTRVDDRAVYSFCMCPGGYIIPAASAPGQLVVNGMSPANRGTRWANSGLVVEILPDDIPDTDDPRHNMLKMMHYQESIESTFFEAAGRTQQAPAQRMTDFVAGRLSTTLPRSSYPPGLISARVDALLPEPVARRMKEAFRTFDHKQRGFLTPEATLIGDETRTSAPVRIPRLPDTLRHIDVPGLYPCGEGAGYAGGIVSAAIDGIMTARAIAATTH
ncbi:MAG: FAD-dependent monooxygenase [Muribaculaceae bacterium]|nr:FAD-dependent monooxygenase [Muribaculaceae bacterium]